jgi:hypothetical protein
MIRATTAIMIALDAMVVKYELKTVTNFDDGGDHEFSSKNKIL